MRSPIVFIHGLIGTLQSEVLCAALRPHETLAPDLLGYGSEAHVDPAIISLEAQAEHVRRAIIAAFGDSPVHLVGHSVGGAIAMLLAHSHPEQVKSVISVEGNFTLKDAFWSASVARMSSAEAEAMINGFRADPAAWLGRSGVAATPEAVVLATDWLSRQPTSTVQAMGKAVVQTTEPASYLTLLRNVFAGIPVHLIAGERSASGWDVPAWAREQAKSMTVVPGTGHMMMIEDPSAFSKVISEELK
ncbi:alpha/beta hydrolase [Rhizobium pusense]|uniref:alpha/beta fold hydrolase n=1 Tax=Agrobacterium pusense TaxID=648995 RepID=UPI001FCDDBD9|nr:alpha/beta hydrolase [Agrobacterium pusense]MCJ2877571.1 alpha/beta hydrolase [Agrobacterium pusense]